MVNGPSAGLILLQTQLERLGTENHFRTSLDYESRVEDGVKVTTSCCYASRDQGSQVWRYFREALSELAGAAGRVRPYDCPNHPVWTNAQDVCYEYYLQTPRIQTGCSYKLHRHKVCLPISPTRCYVSMSDMSIGPHTTNGERCFAQPAVTGSDCFSRCRGCAKHLPGIADLNPRASESCDKCRTLPNAPSCVPGVPVCASQHPASLSPRPCARPFVSLWICWYIHSNILLHQIYKPFAWAHGRQHFHDLHWAQ